MYHAPPHSGGGREPADAPNDKKRPRKQPPNQVWLDAIMSKTRSTEPSPSSELPPPPMHTAMAATTTDEPMDDAGASHWQAHPPPPAGAHLPPHPPRASAMGFPDHHVTVPSAPPSARSSRSPSPVVMAMVAMAAPPVVASQNPFADQLTVGDAALVAALTTALKDLVTEQDCSFVARGLCHLCSDKEKKLVPVVNFCPDFSPTHSLCREHLRSMHRVRLVDIFAGKNQPTVSRRSLRCTVCSLSCPCSKCQLRRDAEIARYRQWLSGPGANGNNTTLEPSPQDDDLPAMTRRGRSRQTAPPPLPPTSAGRDSGGSGGGGGGGYDGQGSHRRYESSRPPSMDRNMDDMPPYAHAEEKRRFSDRPMYYSGSEDKPVSDNGDERYPLHDAAAVMTGVSLRADEKVPVRANRFPKRAAKESVPYALEEMSASYAPRPPPLSAHERTTPSGLLGSSAEFALDLPSPSAASVLNCPDSEKSLVDLLSSLNQRVTPALRYFADTDEPRFRDMMDSAPYTYEREAHETVQHPAEVTAVYANDDYETSMRRQKRKRDSVLSSRANEETSLSVGYDVDDDAPLRENGSVGSSVPLQKDQDGISSYRQKAPTPLATSDRKSKHLPRSKAVEKPLSPSPRGRPSGRTKTSTPPPPEPKLVSSRKRDPPTVLPLSAVSSTRKRKSESLAVLPASMTARKTPRGTAHRGHAHKSSPANHTAEGKRKQGQRASSASNGEAKHPAEEDDDDDEIIEGEGDDESELDTNLDYCEVCLAAGDLVCCDVCPRSFHLKCLKMTEDDLPEGDWQCAECRKPSYFESFGAAVAERTSVPAKCLQIIQCLKSHPFSKPFLLPVENVPHYTNIVKQPMDLSTIEKKLLENKFMVSGKGTMQGMSGVSKILHLGAFAEDVRLVWSNCKLFNDDGSGITRAADQLSGGFEKLYRDVLDFVERANSMRREEKKPTAPSMLALQSKDQDGALGASASQRGTRSVESSSSPKSTSEATQKPPSNATKPDLTSGPRPQQSKQVESSSRSVDEASVVPKGSDATTATTLSSTTSPASEKESQSPSTKESSKRSTELSAERTNANPPSAVSAARSPSPSPVTTATSTPSPTESTTTAFVDIQVTKGSVSASEKQTLPESAQRSAATSDEQANVSKAAESPTVTKDGGNTGAPDEPTK